MTQVISKAGFVPDRWSGIVPVALADYGGGAALVFDVADDLDAVAPHLARLELIVIPFNSSADGRGFSRAAELRTRGFAGHLRARGHVLVDQFRAALRSGFDDVEISQAQARRNPEAQWRAVPMAASYQSRIFQTESAR